MASTRGSACGVEAVTGQAGDLTVTLSDGTALRAGTVVVGIGAVPNDAWLGGSGLVVADGVVCDTNLAAAGAERVFAAGDVAQLAAPGAGGSGPLRALDERGGPGAVRGAQHRAPGRARGLPAERLRLVGPVRLEGAGRRAAGQRDRRVGHRRPRGRPASGHGGARGRRRPAVRRRLPQLAAGVRAVQAAARRALPARYGPGTCWSRCDFRETQTPPVGQHRLPVGVEHRPPATGWSKPDKVNGMDTVRRPSSSVVRLAVGGHVLVAEHVVDVVHGTAPNPRAPAAGQASSRPAGPRNARRSAARISAACASMAAWLPKRGSATRCSICAPATKASTRAR